MQGVSCFVLTADGEVFSWGNNVHGNLGQRSCSPAPALPQRIVFPREAQRIGGIAVGGGHALALSTQGQVFGWGRNISGQVGNGTRQNIPFPVSVHLPDDARPVRKVACGSSHSLALAADGRVFAWGENGRGQLGTGQEGGFCLTPKLVILPPNSASIKTVIYMVLLECHGQGEYYGDIFLKDLLREEAQFGAVCDGSASMLGLQQARGVGVGAGG